MKIMITRPRDQSESFRDSLAAAGFDPVLFPVIEIRPLAENVPLDRVIARLHCYDWVIFTSVNAVDAFFSRVPPDRSGSSSPFRRRTGEEKVKIAAIGPKTARAVEVHGEHPDHIPGEYVAEAIVPGLGDLRGRWVLLPCAEAARKALPDAIAAAGGIPHVIVVYQTLPSQPDPIGLETLRSGVDVITFTSPSTVTNFVQIVRDAGFDPFHLPKDPLVVCIGPVTFNAAQEDGFAGALVAEEYTVEGLLDVIKKIKR